MEITTKFDKIKSIQDMHDFMHYLKADVSFWGCKYVIKQNHSGYLFIDDLARKILTLAESLHYKYTSSQKNLGVAITTRITELYKENDNLLKQRNLFTRIFALLRDFFSSIINQGFLFALAHGFRSRDKYGWFVYGRMDVFSEVH